MEIPAEFRDRVLKTRFVNTYDNRKILSERLKDIKEKWPCEIDFLYEVKSNKLMDQILVICFEEAADYTAFMLIHGKDYV